MAAERRDIEDNWTVRFERQVLAKKVQTVAREPAPVTTLKY